MADFYYYRKTPILVFVFFKCNLLWEKMTFINEVKNPFDRKYNGNSEKTQPPFQK